VDVAINAAAEDVERLRACLSDLLSVMARPGIWTNGAPPDDVIRCSRRRQGCSNASPSMRARWPRPIMN
jgi:hypothetical protein